MININENTRKSARFWAMSHTSPHLDPKLVDAILNCYDDAENFVQAVDFVRSLLPENLSLDKKLEIVKLNVPCRFQISKQVGEYNIRPTVNRHERYFDAPFQHEILNSRGDLIARFNFYLTLAESGQTVLVINLVQGKMGQQEELTHLSKTIGENWRIFLVKEIRKIGQTHNLKVIGQIPSRFAISKKNELKMQLRLCIQTFLKAGIPIEDIDSSKVQEPLKEWAQKNLKTKQERKIEKPKPKRPETRRPRI